MYFKNVGRQNEEIMYVMLCEMHVFITLNVFSLLYTTYCYCSMHFYFLFYFILF